MSKWVVFGLVLAFLLVSMILASRLDSDTAGQLIGVSSSISVATVGFWLYFRKSKS